MRTIKQWWMRRKAYKAVKQTLGMSDDSNNTSTYILAIKAYRQVTGAGLKEAIEFVQNVKAKG